jgi:hypothetical protein
MARPDLVVTLRIANKDGNEYCDGETNGEADCASDYGARQQCSYSARGSILARLEVQQSNEDAKTEEAPEFRHLP